VKVIHSSAYYAILLKRAVQMMEVTFCAVRRPGEPRRRPALPRSDISAANTAGHHGQSCATLPLAYLQRPPSGSVACTHRSLRRTVDCRPPFRARPAVQLKNLRTVISSHYPKWCTLKPVGDFRALLWERYKIPSGVLFSRHPPSYFLRLVLLRKLSEVKGRVHLLWSSLVPLT